MLGGRGGGEGGHVVLAVTWVFQNSGQINGKLLVQGQFQTSNFTCAKSNANKKNLCFRSFALDSAHVKFDV